MIRILVLCTGNSCRSQMAEGFLKKIIFERKLNAEVFSAGIEAHGLNPYAIKVMNEVGIDISGHQSKSLDDLYRSFPFSSSENQSFDYLITVCDNARESCPVFLNAKSKIHRSFPDPALHQGPEEQKLGAFRKVRDDIGAFCDSFPTELF